MTQQNGSVASGDPDGAHLETPLTHLFGLQAPIVLAPMGAVVGPELVAAVSNAGGLGMLPIWLNHAEEIPQAIERVRALTNRPFAVSVNLQWNQAERIAAALDSGASLVHFFWGDPGPLMPALQRAGARALLTVAGADEARRAADAGVAALIAQSWEAGGHIWGRVGGMALIPAVADAAGDVPVVAAGGIVDGRGLAAALALGAAGVLMGSRFVVSEEAYSHPAYRQAIIAAGENDTESGVVFDIGWEGAPSRFLRTPTVRAWEAAGSPPPGARPGEGEIVARMADGRDVPRYHVLPPLAGTEGDLEALCLYAGQGVGPIRGVKPAADIVRDTVAEARGIIADRAAMLG
jgi:NAD(P)H-dependent flavin oxidoreductase YrpB (nitropropane dioxygenase family)